MKDIMLKITGKDLSMEKEEEIVEFYTEGQMSSRGGFICIQYPETELSGMDGCTTSLLIGPSKVRMKRSGAAFAVDTVMEFEKGKRYEGLYDTPYGALHMEVLTNSIEKNLSPERQSGRLSIDYSISLKGLMDSRKVLDIEFNEKEKKTAADN